MGGERVSTDTVETLCHGEHAENGQRQNRALQEERRAIDDHGPCQSASLVLRAKTHRDQRSDQTHERHGDLCDVARPPRYESLHEDTDHGRTEDDQHRQDCAVVDLGGNERCCQPGHRGDHLITPSAVPAFVGGGSVTPT